ncbi:unnamed protein product, partial [Darwinula stevensoni]
MRSLVFGLGATQVLLTIGITALGTIVLAYILPQTWNISWRVALALGGVMAMSSTAIVIKLLSDRLELESEHGKRVVGILLFQDLAVVPLLVLIPALGSDGDNLGTSLLWATLKAAVLLTLLLTGGQKLMRWWLTLVAKRKSEELFILNILLITLGLSWLTEHAGMRLEWRIVMEHWALVLLFLLLSIALKLTLISLIAWMWRASAGVALRSGLYLAQAGEFGLVLLSLAGDNGLVPAELFNPILASMVISMLITPFMVMHSDRLVMKVIGTEWLRQSEQMLQIARKSLDTKEHVIICGYGRCGQNLARLLEGENIAYVALDTDPERVRKAAAAGHSVVYADAARKQALVAAGVQRASAVVVTYLDTQSAIKVVELWVVLCRYLKLPAILGYLVVGVIIGPGTLALVQNTQAVHYLAEFGVVFLMFVIGLEFSLPKLQAMRSLVFGLGAT